MVEDGTPEALSVVAGSTFGEMPSSVLRSACSE